MIRASLVSFLALTALSACGHAPPDQVNDACLILEDNRSWWRALQRTEERWGVPAGVQLAILKRESSFNAHARPARRRLLGIIPGRAPHPPMVMHRHWTKPGTGTAGTRDAAVLTAMIFLTRWILSAGTRPRVVSSPAFNPINPESSTCPITRGMGAIIEAHTGAIPGSCERPTRLPRMRSAMKTRFPAAKDGCHGVSDCFEIAL